MEFVGDTSKLKEIYTYIYTYWVVQKKMHLINQHEHKHDYKLCISLKPSHSYFLSEMAPYPILIHSAAIL